MNEHTGETQWRKQAEKQEERETRITALAPGVWKSKRCQSKRQTTALDSKGRPEKQSNNADIYDKYIEAVSKEIQLAYLFHF